MTEADSYKKISHTNPKCKKENKSISFYTKIISKKAPLLR